MSRVGWNRKLRLVMIAVLLLIGWMAVDAAMSVLSARSQAHAEMEIVQRYSQANHRLEREALALSRRGTIIIDARELGMIAKGEQGMVDNSIKPPGN